MRKSDITSTSAIASELPIATATAASIKNIERDGKREEPISIDYKEQQHLNKEDEEEAELVDSLNKLR